MRFTRKDFRERLRSSAAAGIIRRYRVLRTKSKRVNWTLEGHTDSDGNVEVENAEAFQEVGFFSRPKISDRAEAIAVKVGLRSNHPAIIATRSQDGVKRLGKTSDDETIVFTSGLMVRITQADGKIYIGSIGGTFKALATKDDLDALADWVSSHTHTGVTTGGGVSGGPSPSPPVPSATGTTKLKAE